MRKILVMIVMAALAAVLLIGCKADNLVPYFTRWNANTTCGVAPLLVQFTARASGGDEGTDPTGANSYLTIDWDFQDGHTANGSLAYHTFDAPGDYDVALTVKDKDGDGETKHILVDVRADSLTLRAVPVGTGSGPDTTVNAGDVIDFTVYAHACGFDTDGGNYDTRFLFAWNMDDAAQTVYHGRAPHHQFTAADAGLRRVVLTVVDDQASVTRRDTVTVQVDTPGR